MRTRYAIGLYLLLGCWLTGCGMGSTGTVEISPRSVTLAPGQTQQFSVTVTNCPHTAVDWRVVGGSSDGTISDAGVYQAPDEPGTYTIRAECREDTNIYDDVMVTVE